MTKQEQIWVYNQTYNLNKKLHPKANFMKLAEYVEDELIAMYDEQIANEILETIFEHEFEKD